MVKEAFINGVSTRKIERLARALGIDGISASQVSEMTKGLEERMKEFRSRPLSEDYPFFWIDAIDEKVRSDGRVVGVFPSVDSYLRLVVSYLMEYTKDWTNDYAYIKPDKLAAVLENEIIRVAN